MRKSFLSISFAFFCGLQLWAGEPVRMTVMTYNLRFGELASLQDLGHFIKAQEPDFVALQELDWMTRRDKAPHQHDKGFITELGYYSEMFPLYGKTIPYAGGLYGIGILTAKPYIQVEKVMLPKDEKVTEYRALLLATVELANGDTIVFASTHLDYSGSGARKMQIDRIKQTLEAVKYPVLLGGDFNATPDSGEMKEGFANWANLSGPELTSPADHPHAKIDYLWGFPKGKWQLVSSRIETVQLSDHLPVISVVELLTK